MASEERKGRRQRLFVAVDLPDGIREGLSAWGEAELVDPALRPVRPESLHVTLVFLGNREADEVEALVEAVGGMSAPAVLMKSLFMTLAGIPSAAPSVRAAASWDMSAVMSPEGFAAPLDESMPLASQAITSR